MISADPTKKTLPAHRHAPAQGSFRLLDLPRELRDEIYGSALTYKLKEAAFHDVPPPFERPNLNLLRCSKQLNQEATKAFVISNLLIKVEMNIVHLTRGCCPKPITWINGLDGMSIPLQITEN